MSEFKKPLKVTLHLRIETDSKVFGRGHVQLLDKIRETGSLNSACTALKLSYSKAWKIMTHAEEELGFALLYAKIGGKGGGGSTLTTEGEDFLRRYKLLYEETNAAAQISFQKYFGDQV